MGDNRTMEQENKLVRIILEVRPELRNKFKGKCASDGQTIKGKILEWIRKYINE